MNYSKQIILKNDQGDIVTLIVDGNRVKLLGTWQHLSEWEVVSQESKANLDSLAQEEDSVPFNPCETVFWKDFCEKL